MSSPKRIKLGNTQQKLLTLLFSGIGFSLSRNPRQQLKILTDLRQDMQELSKQNSERALTALEKHGYIQCVRKRGGLEPTLTKAGRRQAYLAALNDIELKKPRRWDGKWRIVSFDIPEESRHARDTFRGHLQRLGFFELHQSLFVVPWPCEKEVRIIAEQLRINEYVHSIIADELDHEETVQQWFNLS